MLSLIFLTFRFSTPIRTDTQGAGARASGGGARGTFAPPGFGHLVKHLINILTFCVIILTFGQNTNISSPKKICSPTKIPVYAREQEGGRMAGKPCV